MSLNEEATIGRALESLTSQVDSNDTQMIVIAGGTDRTADICRKRLEDVQNAVFIHDTTPRGKPAALNEIFSRARGDILILSDGDVRVTEGAVDLMVKAFESADVGGASGRVTGAQGRYNAVEKVCNVMTETMHISRRRMYMSNGTIDLASGYLIAIRRDLLPRVPEDTSSDDGFLSLSVRSSGKRIAYVEDAKVVISYPRTIADFLNQKSRTRYGHLQLMRQFQRGPIRGSRREFGESTRLGEARASLGYGVGILALALVLTGLAWISAYMRMYMPWIARGRVWRPVPSTKR